MKLRLSGSHLTALRATAVGGFVAAFLFAVFLSAAPQLHERIHQPGGATHQCVVTLLSTGNCDHTPCDVIAIAPCPPKPSVGLFGDESQLETDGLEFSLLEHAPPAIS